MAQEGSSDQRHSRLPVQSPGPGSGTALEGSFVKLVFVTAVTGRDAVFSRCFRECPAWGRECRCARGGAPRRRGLSRRQRKGSSRWSEGVRLPGCVTVSARRPDICRCFIHSFICFLGLNTYAYVYVYVYVYAHIYVYVAYVCV